MTRDEFNDLWAVEEIRRKYAIPKETEQAILSGAKRIDLHPLPFSFSFGKEEDWQLFVYEFNELLKCEGGCGTYGPERICKKCADEKKRESHLEGLRQDYYRARRSGDHASAVRLKKEIIQQESK